ncbi:tryptophan synthase subunit alpha [Marinicella litoralis]|uniref:Tryptophan synthase alpha chain n=1 Tax=Marinicella litoralis TaxID=644220 RepID=A0A4R6XRH9_9GAMM|nr:tryptophan synthase subunit alpha [Marinicella litoralis]TDR22492.1 tryptophan synthase alpha chain [Marinicella litoralis]
MSLLKTMFETLGTKKALIPFITAGHPKPDLTVDIMHELVNAGADVIELGMPFSDPMADGPVIQLASEKAISQGVGIDHVIEMVKQFRSTNQHTPVVLMGYLNPIECKGNKVFVEQAKMAGVDALLLVDSPPEESADLLENLKSHDMEQIFLVAPTTTDARKQMICQHASGFIYYVALKGVTGSADLDCHSVDADVQSIQQLTDLPVAVGFGVKDAASAVSVASKADAVVIGSALVSLLDGCTDLASASNAIRQFIKPIRTALDSL